MMAVVQFNRSLLHATLLFLFLFLMGDAIALASTSAVDACGVIKDSIQQTQSKVDILVDENTTSILLVDCHIPASSISNNLHVKILFPGDVEQNGVVHLDMKNSSLELGSLTIKPTDAASSFQTSWIRDLVITVENMVLVGSQHVLVVDTSAFAPSDALVSVSNVTMTISNSILRSYSTGSVASFLTGSGLLHDVSVHVFGNTTLTTNGYMVASIMALRVTNVTLVVDTSSCQGPTILLSSTHLSQAVGALALVRPALVSKAALFVTNLHILVRSQPNTNDDEEECSPGSTDITMIAVVGHGTAAVGGIALCAYESDLQLTGDIRIQFQLAAAHKKSVSSGGDGTSADDITSHRLHANVTSTGLSSAATVGGIAVNSYRQKDYIKSQLFFHNNCSVLLSLSNQRGGDDYRSSSPLYLSIVSFIFNGPSAASAFGVAVNTNSYRATTGHLQLGKGVNLTIATVLNTSANTLGGPNIVGRNDVSVSSIIVGGGSASTVFGVLANSYSHNVATSKLIIKQDARLDILVVASGGGLRFRASTDHHSTSGIGTICMGANQPSGEGKSVLKVEQNGAASIRALLLDQVSFDVAVTRENVYNSVGLFSFVVFGRDTTTLQSDGSMMLWVGAATSAALLIEGNPSLGAACGVATVDDPFFNKAATSFSFCSDGSATPTVRTPHTRVVTTNKPDGGVPFIVSSALHWPPTNSGCSQQAAAVFNDTLLAVHLILPPLNVFAPQAPNTDHTPTVSHTRSLTHGAKSDTKSWTSSIPTLTRSASPTTNTVVIKPRTFSPTASNTIELVPHGTLTRTQSLMQSGDGETDTPEPVSDETPINSTRPSERKNTVSVMIPGNEEAATVVVSSAGATNAVVSTMGSGGAGVVVVAGSAVKLLQCGLAEDDPKPAAFELPISFAVGDSPVKYYVGAVLAHTLLQCLLLALPTFVRRRTIPKSKLLTLFSLMFCGTHPFFTATILGGVTTILFHNDGETFATAIAVLCGLVIITMHTVVSVAIQFAPRNGVIAVTASSSQLAHFKLEFDVQSSEESSAESQESSNTDEESRREPESHPSQSTASSRSVRRRPILFSAHYTRDVFLTLFDGCRIFSSSSHRHYSTVEVTLASLVAMISGARPSQHCDSAAYSIAVLAVCGLGYVVGVRPFRTRLDLIFSVINNLLLVTLSASVVTTLKSTDESNHPAERTMQLSLWLISVIAFVQLGVQGCWAYYVTQRRRHLLLANDNNPLEVPMLPMSTSRDYHRTIRSDVHADTHSDSSEESWSSCDSEEGDSSVNNGGEEDATLRNPLIQV